MKELIIILQNKFIEANKKELNFVDEARMHEVTNTLISALYYSIVKKQNVKNDILRAIKWLDSILNKKEEKENEN